MLRVFVHTLSVSGMLVCISELETVPLGNRKQLVFKYFPMTE